MLNNLHSAFSQFHYIKPTCKFITAKPLQLTVLYNFSQCTNTPTTLLYHKYEECYQVQDITRVKDFSPVCKNSTSCCTEFWKLWQNSGIIKNRQSAENMA